MTCADIDFKRPRVKDEKVIYTNSLDQPVNLAVLEVVDDGNGEIAYWLCWRGSKERYYDGKREVFGGEQLGDDDSSGAD